MQIGLNWQTLLFVVGALVVVGVIIWDNRRTTKNNG